MDWFRSYHGAPTDPKWLVIGRLAGVEPGVVAAVWWALMDHASQAHPRGSVASFDEEAVAAFFGWPEESIDAVVEALKKRRMIEDGMLSRWLDRNPSDFSTERVRAHRRRKTSTPTTSETPGNARNAGNAMEHRGEEIEEITTTRRVANVENSDAIERLRFELLDHAKRECGMGQWTVQEIHTASSVISAWARMRTKTATEVYEAIHGARLLVDRNKVDWVDKATGQRTMLPGKPFGLQALVNTTTLFNQGDGSAPRPFFDCAREEYRRAEPTGPPSRQASTGPERLNVNLPNLKQAQGSNT